MAPDPPTSEARPDQDRSHPPADPGLLLVGHGSHRSHRSSLPVRALARQLRARRLFPEVRVAFWKEDPHLHHALDAMERPQVVVLPVFTSTGYFTEVVVPRELGLRREDGAGSDRRVLLCDPVGTHPRMVELVLERALEVSPDPNPEASAQEAGAQRSGGQEASAQEAAVALVVVGHGTPRHPESGAVTLGIVRRLASRWRRGPVAAAFLDQEPRVSQVIRALGAEQVVVVPFFISEGWHAGVTLPDGLGLEEGWGRVEGRAVRYAHPVGTHPALAEVVVEMVEEARRRVGRWGAEPEGPAPPSPTLALQARGAFLDWIAAGGPEGRRFLQLRILPAGEGGFHVLHQDDVGLPMGDLAHLPDPEAAGELAATTGDGRHRPLSTAPDLRRGWCFPSLPAEEVWEVLSHLYPGAAVHWHLGRTGATEPVPFREVASRHTGIYATLRRAPEPAVHEAVEACCHPGACLRRVVWPVEAGARPGEHPRPPSLDEGAVPCLEPCSLLLTRVLEAMDPEDAP